VASADKDKHAGSEESPPQDLACRFGVHFDPKTGKYKQCRKNHRSDEPAHHTVP
jgi:hypothetical protein